MPTCSLLKQRVDILKSALKDPPKSYRIIRYGTAYAGHTSLINLGSSSKDTSLSSLSFILETCSNLCSRRIEGTRKVSVFLGIFYLVVSLKEMLNLFSENLLLFVFNNNNLFFDDGF